MSGPGLLMFCLRSLRREYGLQFMIRIVLRYPIRTLAGLRAYRRKQGPMDGRTAHRQVAASPRAVAGPKLVGLGFCLKPLDPPCPSGRANHECEFFQLRRNPEDATLLPACRGCRIREIGLRALEAGCALYIMTSARDILFDLLLPALRERRFRSALLGMCRYSIEPFRIALCIVGLDAEIVPFAEGDCNDYRSWRLADKGFKDEQTRFGAEELATIRTGLDPRSGAGDTAYRKRGNVFFPGTRD